MKMPWDQKDIVKGIIAFLVTAAAISFYMIIHRWETVSTAVSIIFKSLRPVTYGLLFAYILNPLMNTLEKRLVFPSMKRIMRKKPGKAVLVSRNMSVFLTWAIAITAILILVELVFPELYSSIESLIISMPGYANKLLVWVSDVLRQNTDVLAFLKESINGFSTDVSEIAKRLQDIMPNINSIISGVSSSVADMFRTILNLFIGVIVSIYVLKDKEKFAAQIKKILYSMFSVRRANSIIALVRLTDDKFSNFLTGKIFDSAIIGVICFVLLTIFKIPYSALVSVIVGITNVIPFFGPFIGAVPSAFLILLADPIKCLTFIIIILILQQFDGNILGPKILGSSTGVSSFWVMFSILVGSSIFGFWGMLFGVPVFAVIYELVKNSCNMSLEEKGFDYPTEKYMIIDHISSKTEKPVLFKDKQGG